jgi:hypothetical protein
LELRRGLEERYQQTGGKSVVDSAFATGSHLCLIKSSENLTKTGDALELIRMKEAKSLMQALEWGMRALQGAFPRLTEPIKYEEKGERGLMFCSFALQLQT